MEVTSKFMDFIAKQPTKVLDNTIIDEKRLSVPTEINRPEFYKMFKDEIESPELTYEKSLYAGALGRGSTFKSINDLLIKGR